MVIEIDKARAIELLEQVVEIRGADYKYKPEGIQYAAGGCFYADVVTKTPSCGVGYALHLAGVDIETLYFLDKEDETSISVLNERPGEEDETVLETFGIILDHGAEKVFQRFQSYQDNGAAYTDSLNAAKGV